MAKNYKVTGRYKNGDKFEKSVQCIIKLSCVLDELFDEREDYDMNSFDVETTDDSA